LIGAAWNPACSVAGIPCLASLTNLWKMIAVEDRGERRLTGGKSLRRTVAIPDRAAGKTILSSS
jgi:hypothetical protein